VPRLPSAPLPLAATPLPADAQGVAGHAAAAYTALLARDARFDGRLFVGVTSTGIYCRPICRVRTPKAANCRFFSHAAQAEASGFRPCLRCRPELAPGLAAIDMPSRLAWAAAQRIDAGALDHADLAALAARLGITGRHLRRVFQATLGVSPVAYAQTRRLLLAKQLLTDTALPITEVALAAGFGSLRRFNDLFRTRYHLTPGTLRRTPAAGASARGVADESPGLRFTLAWRPPMDWSHLSGFLATRSVPGVEQVEGSGEAATYRRTVRLMLGDRCHSGWISLAADARRQAVVLTVAPSLQAILPAVLAGARRLCDLSCEPQAVALALGPLAADAPGVRVPGAFDGFELAVRAVLGQQVTVKAAHTLAGRLVQALGEPVATPWPGLDRLFPTPQAVAAASPDLLGGLGIVRQRVRALQALAQAVADEQLDLGPAADVEATLAALQALPGIGPWTAHYIAMRALACTDAWPSGDVALIKALAVPNARAADVAAEAWRPWRAYAVMHLWRRAALPVADISSAPTPRPAACDPTPSCSEESAP